MKTFLPILLIVVLTTSISAADPHIGIFFEPDKSPVGPWTSLRIGEIGEAYVMVDDAEMMVGGASFRVEEYGGMVVLNAVTAPGIAIGDIFTGLELGLFDPIPQFMGDKALLATITFLCPDLVTHEFGVMPHPNTGLIEVADSAGLTYEATGGFGTAEAYIRPDIGLYFDEAGTTLNGTFNGGPGEEVPAWILIQDTDVPINYVYLSLELPESVDLISATLPDGCTLTAGNLIDGAILNFDPPLVVGDGEMGPVASLLLDPGDVVLVPGEELGIGGYPPYEMYHPCVNPVHGWIYYYCTSPVSTISVPVESESTTWSGVKTLFR